MKRRVNALSSSTQASKKKKAWQEDDDEAPAAKAKKPPPPPEDSDDDLLRDRVGSDEEAERRPPPPPPSGPNPVVWMDLSVAGKAVGRVHFELFRDLYPTVTNNFRGLCSSKAGYQGTEFDAIVIGEALEGGDLDHSDDLPAIERDCSKLRHAKAGLLTASPGGPSFGSARFQLTLGARPDLDGRQLVFGQVLSPGDGLATDKLHPLHWVEAVGTTSAGAPREAVVIEACGECDTAEQEAVLGAMVMAAQMDSTAESEEDRFGRAGMQHGKLVDAITGENLVEVLNLTDDLVLHFKYAAKKLKADPQKDRKAKEMEVRLKDLASVLEKVQHKTGEVSGFDNKLASKVKEQRNSVRELESAMTRIV